MKRRCTVCKDRGVTLQRWRKHERMCRNCRRAAYRLLLIAVRQGKLNGQATKNG